MITTVCLNPSFDKTAEVDDLTPGQLCRVQRTRLDAGGKGVNVALGVRSLGGDARVIGFLGEEDAPRYEAMLDAEGLESRFVRVPGSIRTNLKIFSRKQREVTEINESGAAVTPEAFAEFEKVLAEACADSDWLVLTGSLPPGCGEDTYRRLIQDAAGLRCILDVGGKPLLEGVKAAPYLIKPNLFELEQTVCHELTNLQDIVYAAQRFLVQGVEIAVVSLGAEGAVMVDRDRALYAPALKVEAASTVGAGDAMISGLLTGFIRSDDPVEAFRSGIAAATASVLTEGTQAPSAGAYQELLKQVQIREV